MRFLAVVKDLVGLAWIKIKSIMQVANCMLGKYNHISSINYCTAVSLWLSVYNFYTGFMQAYP